MHVCVDVDFKVPAFNCLTIAGCYPEPSSGFKVIALSHSKSAGWFNLASVPTLAACRGANGKPTGLPHNR